MYMHPEISRTIAIQRSQEIQARAEASRQIAEARAARRPSRPQTARYRWLARRTAAARPAVAYPSPRNA
jgi:hypothetical protein